MTREEFIEILDIQHYSYKVEGNKIIITKGEGHELAFVYLKFLTSLPPGVEFKVWGDVYLDYLTSLPPDTEFNNAGSVILNSLTSLPSSAEFNNGGSVWLSALISGRFDDWKGNIEGVNWKRLLNKMISLGVFER